MAFSGTQSSDSAKESKTTCPICFESFRTPRYLPCSHTFCHNCLSSYILSTCKSKENPVGFPCPLCRQFVPAPSFLGEPDKWTEHIPINEIVQAICEKKDQWCDACRRADEEEIATAWCKSCSESLCSTCMKCHKRSAASQNHELIPIAGTVKVPIRIESRVFCKDHSAPVEYMCVDHEELCCTKCVCTKHRKCGQVDEIEKAAENLLQSDELDKLTHEIQKYDEVLLQAQTDGGETLKYIDDTSDKILEECTEVRDKVLKHITFVVESHFTDLAQKAKEQKEKLSIFVDTVSDRHFLMVQFSQTLKDTEKTPVPILMQNYLNIKKQFKHVTGMFLYRPSVKLQSEASKELSRILDTFRLPDIGMEIDSLLLGSIDFTSTEMNMVCELPDSEVSVFGGCFLENGDIVLAHYSSKQCLYLKNEQLARKISVKGDPRDVLYLKPSKLLISMDVKCKGHVEHFDLEKFKNIEDKCIPGTNRYVHHLATSSGFVYAACSDFIIKLDNKGNTVDQIGVDENTYSVAVNKQQEIISSSCRTNKVTIMDKSGEKMYSYSHENLKYPYGLDINFSGNIFVAGYNSHNIHVLTPTAELLKIFEVDSPRCIKFKENSNICFVSSHKNKTKVFEFVPNKA